MQCVCRIGKGCAVAVKACGPLKQLVDPGRSTLETFRVSIVKKEDPARGFEVGEIALGTQ
eukprot:2482700-Prorocentrum_lima.AAC.1